MVRTRTSTGIGDDSHEQADVDLRRTSCSGNIRACKPAEFGGNRKGALRKCRESRLGGIPGDQSSPGHMIAELAAGSWTSPLLSEDGVERLTPSSRAEGALSDSFSSECWSSPLQAVLYFRLRIGLVRERAALTVGVQYISMREVPAEDPSKDFNTLYSRCTSVPFSNGRSRIFTLLSPVPATIQSRLMRSVETLPSSITTPSKILAALPVFIPRPDGVLAKIPTTQSSRSSPLPSFKQEHPLIRYIMLQWLD